MNKKLYIVVDYNIIDRTEKYTKMENKRASIKYAKKIKNINNNTMVLDYDTNVIWYSKKEKY